MSKAVIMAADAFKKPRAYTDLMVFSDVRPYIPRWDSKDYLRGCQKYAQENGVYVVPTRVVMGDGLFLCLIAPGGEILGVQAAASLNLSFGDHLLHDDAVNVLETPLGRLFLCVDTDIYSPAVLRLAKLQGAEIVISSQYIDSYQFNREMIRDGIWNAAQQQGVYVVGCCNHCKAVAAPMELTEDASGYLVKPAQESMMQVKLFTKKLEKLRYPVEPLDNHEFLEGFSRLMIRE